MTETSTAIPPISLMLPPEAIVSYQGRLAIDHITKRAVPYRGRVSVCSFKVLHLTAAIIGPSVE